MPHSFAPVANEWALDVGKALDATMLDLQRKLSKLYSRRTPLALTIRSKGLPLSKTEPARENEAEQIFMGISLRLAHDRDIPTLRPLIEASVLGLQAGDYSPAQLKQALKTVYGVDTQLIADGTYFVAEAEEGSAATTIVGCGGWSRRKTLYGGDQWVARQDSLLDPARDAAKIRAFFIHPAWARRGIGGMILEACEQAAQAAGFRRLEMGATLTGVPFYLAKGYVPLEKEEVPMGDGMTLPIVRMGKAVGGE